MLKIHECNPTGWRQLGEWQEPTDDGPPKAHLLLQVRCAVLDGRLDAPFREQYPRFRLTSPALELPGL
jgi:hypothetical protein